MIPFAQPSIFSLDDKIPEDEEDGKQKSRPGKRSMRPTLILEEEIDSVTVIFMSSSIQISDIVLCVKKLLLNIWLFGLSGIIVDNQTLLKVS